MSVFNDDILQMSFMLSIFDNIVGPRVVHHWRTKLISSKDSSNSQPSTQYEAADLLKYVAIHTLNGELYQDKLVNQLKFRLYLIQEVECAVFSVFFDAHTMTTSSFSHEVNEENLPQNKNSSLTLNRSNKSRLQVSSDYVQTALNCFSVIVPLEHKDIFLKFYGDNTTFFLNWFENIVMEYKIYAHIMPKVNQITKAVRFLTESLRQFCNNLIILQNRGLYNHGARIQSNKQLNDSESQNMFNICVSLTSNFIYLEGI